MGGMSKIVNISTHVHFDEISYLSWFRGKKTTHLWDIFGKWHSADHWFLRIVKNRASIYERSYNFPRARVLVESSHLYPILRDPECYYSDVS